MAVQEEQLPDVNEKMKLKNLIFISSIEIETIVRILIKSALLRSTGFALSHLDVGVSTHLQGMLTRSMEMVGRIDHNGP